MTAVSTRPPHTNPLLGPIGARLDMLTASMPLAGELKEGDLLGWLRAEGWVEDRLADSALYKVHFLMRNALYRLMPEYPGFSWHLDVLGVRWQALDTGAGQEWRSLAHAPGSAALAEYYLNWANLDLSADDVERLLDSFWRRYAGFTAEDQIAPALAALGLSALPEDLGALKHHYRRRVALAHPDKGGAQADTAEMQRLNDAYARLKLVLKAKVP